MRYLFIWCLLITPHILCELPQFPNIGFDGFVKQVNFWDSRQVVSSRFGDYTFFPKEKRPDAQGCDINSQGDFGMWAIDTTLTVTIGSLHLGGDRGPTMGGKVAVNFFGVFDEFIDIATLTFGFMTFEWEKSHLLLGQMTIPTFFFQIGPNKYLDTYDVIAPAFESNQAKNVYDDPIPRTVSYAYGAPMEPFAYEPMVRFMHTFAHNWHMLLSAHIELEDNSSVGFTNATPKPFVLPPSIVSGEFLRNAQNPVVNAQLHKYFSNESAIITGFQFRRIRPRLVTDLDYKAHEDVQSWSAYAAVKLKWDPVTTILKCYYTQNGFADGNLGTYGIRTINPVTHQFTYTPSQGLNLWLDCRPSKDHRYAPGIFAGFYKNLGTTHPLVNINEVSPAWGFTSYKDVMVKGNLVENNQDLDIDWMIKIVPRIFIAFKRLQIGAELEYHYVRFGTIQQNGRVANTYPVNHVRFLTGFFYYF